MPQDADYREETSNSKEAWEKYRAVERNPNAFRCLLTVRDEDNPDRLILAMFPVAGKK